METAGRDWWRRGVIYQVYPRSFADSNGDGIGDLRGIAARLDHLNDGTSNSLGVTGLWLSPFYPSPQVDFGYDVSDYCDVDPTFGLLSDFDDLLAAAHARGIRVLVDLVPNHTSDRHPWFIESRASRASPKRAWYVWADGRPGGGPPNNWLSAFRSAGPAWTFDPATGQFYLHSFTPQQPDLNWWNPEVREAMDRVLRFWLGRGVDGFRIDVANRLTKDPALGDNPPEVAALRSDSTAHSASMRNVDWPETHAVLRDFRRTLDEFGAVAVGEVAIVDLGRMVRYYGAGDELQMVFNFSFWLQPWEATAFRSVIDQVEALLPEGAWPVYALSNHDISRAISRYGGEDRSEARARLAAMMLLTLRGTPFLYYGEEIGMTDVPRARATDPDGRDAFRTPMQWDAGPGAGFTTGSPWLPISETTDRVSVAAQDGDPGSLLNLYRRLIWLRRGSEALQVGSYAAVDVEDPRVFAFERRVGDERVLVALNFSDERVPLCGPATLPVAAVRRASTRAELPVARVPLDPPYELAPLEGVIFE